MGHRVTIVTHAEYKEWIEGFGLDHREAGGDPGALMLLSVENKVSLIVGCDLVRCMGWTLSSSIDVLSTVFQAEFVECEQIFCDWEHILC